jgi:hypothetical protein
VETSLGVGIPSILRTCDLMQMGLRRGCKGGGSLIVSSTPSYIVACKLKALKLDLKKWNEEVLGMWVCERAS